MWLLNLLREMLSFKWGWVGVGRSQFPREYFNVASIKVKQPYMRISMKHYITVRRLYLLNAYKYVYN